MKTTITKTTKSGIEVNYELRAEEGRFNLYASVKGSDFYKISGSQRINNELYYYIENEELNSYLGVKEGQKINIPFFEESSLREELKNNIINSNMMIEVSFLSIHQDYVVEFGLKCNLTEKEAEEYLTYEDNNIRSYIIPAKNLYVARQYNSDKNTKTICVSCQQEYDIIDNNGKCTHCGF
jgi:hypothetical protein